MQQFVIERQVPGASSLSREDLTEVVERSKKALCSLGNQISWSHSLVTDDKIYCFYNATDAETVHEHARRADIPADRVAAVRHVLTADFAAG